MITFLLFVVVLALPPLWLFVRTRPRTSRPDLLRRFNALIFFVTSFSGAAVWIAVSQSGEVRDQYIAVIAAVAAASTALLIGALARLLVFRKLG